jgi:hypothetical protein
MRAGSALLRFVAGCYVTPELTRDSSAREFALTQAGSRTAVRKLRSQ